VYIPAIDSALFCFSKPLLHVCCPVLVTVRESNFAIGARK